MNFMLDTVQKGHRCEKVADNQDLCLVFASPSNLGASRFTSE